MKYTFSDDDFGSDDLSGKRSMRNSGISTPLETGPTVTASGRHVKSRVGGVYGESMLIDQRKELERAAGEGHFTETSDDMPTTMPIGRGARASRSGRPVKIAGQRYTDGMDSDSDEAQSSGKEWSGNEDEPDESEPDFDAEDEDDDLDEEMSDEGLEPDELAEDDNTQESLVVQLRYRKAKEATSFENRQAPPPSQQLTNSIPANGTIQSEDVIKPLQIRPESPIIDTIDVAPRPKGFNALQPLPNGVKGIENEKPMTPPVPIRIPVQPMDMS